MLVFDAVILYPGYIAMHKNDHEMKGQIAKNA